MKTQVTFVIMQTALSGNPFCSRISEHKTLAEARAAMVSARDGDEYMISREEYNGDTHVKTTRSHRSETH